MLQVKSPAILNGLSVDQFKPKYKRLLLPIALTMLLLSSATRDVTMNALADAFWAVSTYVAFTLVIYHQVARVVSSQNRVVELYHQSPTYQVLISSMLGAFRAVVVPS